MELLAGFQRYLGMSQQDFNHNHNLKDSPVLAGLSDAEKEAAIQNAKRGTHSAVEHLKSENRLRNQPKK